jgi:hypothetical protein
MAPLKARSLERALMMVEFLAVQEVLANTRPLLSLHGALASREGRAVVIVGPCHGGKSTLACGLWQRGWSLLCDDLTLIDAETGIASPTPRRVSLRRASRQLLGEQLWRLVLESPSCDETDEGYLFHPDECDGKPRPRDVRLAGIIFLARLGANLRPAELRRLEPVRASLALLPYSNVVRWLGGSAAISRIGKLVQAVPSYDLGRSTLSEMVDRIEEVVNDRA